MRPACPPRAGGHSTRRLLHECLQTREDDVAGRRWSATRYPGGYTSYGSLCRMHTTVADVRRARAQAAPSRAVLRTGARVRPRGPRTRDDRLLDQRDAAARGAQPAPAPAVDDQRHLLRAHAAGRPGPQVRGSAARQVHGRPAPPARLPHRVASHGSRCRRPLASWCCSRAGCVTRCRRTRSRPSASASASTTGGSERPRRLCRPRGVDCDD